jgi:hypothetical protein
MISTRRKRQHSLTGVTETAVIWVRYGEVSQLGKIPV